VPGTGIHSHIARQIYYIPANKEHSEMAWVGIKRRDGTYLEFINPAYQPAVTKEKIRKGSRLMDCIDCHNRAAHDFVPFEQLLDMAITRKDIPQSLPYIKREAMQAVGEVTGRTSDKEYQQALRQIRAIPDFYRKQYPDLFKEENIVIKRAVDRLNRVYTATVFPHMNVGPNTYPNWRTHTGCFRCHGTLVPKGKGQPISQDCNLCHSMPVEGSQLSLNQ
jgi:hypothetical protein